MSRTTGISHRGRWPGWRLGLGLTVFMLAGCASSISARVTSFQQWSDSYEGQTYRIDTPEQSRGNLEYSSYEDMLRAALGATGLVEARDGAPARFLAGFSYQIKPVTALVEEPIWWGMGPPGFRPRFYGYGYGYWGGPPEWVTRPVAAKEYRLTVTIQDQDNEGKEVYRSTAEHVGAGDSESLEVAPYLFRAVFDHFPGNNGQVRRVNYQLSD
ncbi:DUF4136 domain-containing protein [Kerstersia gyiorum]|uniref:DUF4136 domain-containing protein n=1 Tax=Kerstersia gyiorum TaxID=206506 RepID=UPI00214FA259|nr:DUF4136 domain-containing protein [Kerstersia gyiorum]MCR4159024.1 DUF4136 domain-containing protein [Kerstersia gyiorum]